MWLLRITLCRRSYSLLRSIVCLVVVGLVGSLLFVGVSKDQFSIDQATPRVLRSSKTAPTDPQLSPLVSPDGRIIGNVSDLLSFAIIGHAKAATDLMLRWLSSHPELVAANNETWFLSEGQPAKMVQHLLHLPEGKRGYKSPHDISNLRALDLIATYWPDAKLIVGLRHPIEWFESYYNFKAWRKHVRHAMPQPQALIGQCPGDPTPVETKHDIHGRLDKFKTPWVCTGGARFHGYLSYLGKTNVSDPNEDRLLGPRLHTQASGAPLPNKVFLYDTSQLNDYHSNEFDELRIQLGQFLELSTPLDPPAAVRYSNASHYNSHHKDPFDICLAQYRDIRAELLKHGTAASTWILDYLMKHPDVTVGSPDFFRRSLLNWQKDPCHRVD